MSPILEIIAEANTTIPKRVKRTVRRSALGFGILASTIFWKGLTSAMPKRANAIGSNTTRAKLKGGGSKNYSEEDLNGTTESGVVHV
jgi:hypothetical protein